MSTSFIDVPDDTPIPEPEPDASRRQITARPLLGEYGIDTVGRQIAEHVAHLLAWPVTDLTIRENPWHRRPCPHASFYDLTCAGHHIRITLYEAFYPRRHDTYTAHAITLDGLPIPFHRLPVDPIAWQLAHAIWLAHLDLPEHPHPVGQADDTDRTRS